ncbi:MAG: autotransporter outer membrane beta-barrel domain-containing protein [Verrucomicrobiales bacterium]|nr:autotransporter outer membrane beta-barrel domain-containing protein [Verrucomicrobiales bacterium]
MNFREKLSFDLVRKSDCAATLLFLVAMCVGTSVLQAQTVVYQDSFDNDTLAANAGTGGGLSNRSFGGHFWQDNGNLNFNRAGSNNFQNAALAYSMSTFQSNEGFELSVDYSDGSFGAAARRLSFGLVSSATNLGTYTPSTATNRNPFSDSNLYSFGLTVREGLRFTDGATVTTLEAGDFQAGSSAFISILNDGMGGADWSFSIDGLSQATGNIATFDFGPGYHFVAYGQDNEGARSLQSVMLAVIDPVIDPVVPAVNPVVARIDTGALSQLVGSAIPMNLAVGQAASRIHNVGSRALNQRISRLRQRLSDGSSMTRSAGSSREVPASSYSNYARLNGKLEVSNSIDLNGRASRPGTPANGEMGVAPVIDDAAPFFPSITQEAGHSMAPGVVAAGEKWEVFASADFGQYEVDPLSGASGLESNTYASTAGVEYLVNEQWAVGAGWSHLWSDNTLKNGLGSFDIEGDSAMAYASYFKNNFWGDLLYSFGDYDVDIRRNTQLGSTVTGNPDLESHQASLNLGYNIPKEGRFVHGPTFRADYGWGHLDGYTERGDIRANTIFQDQDYQSLITTLGWQINWETETTFGAMMRPNFRIGYGRENLDQETNVSGTLQQSPFSTVNLAAGNVLGRGASVTNTLSQVDPGEGWMEIGVGVGIDFSNNFGIYADYQGRVFQDNAHLHLGTIKASWKW